MPRISKLVGGDVIRCTWTLGVFHIIDPHRDYIDNVIDWLNSSSIDFTYSQHRYGPGDSHFLWQITIPNRKDIVLFKLAWL